MGPVEVREQLDGALSLADAHEVLVARHDERVQDRESLLAELLDLVVGVVIGVISAVRQYSWVDNVITVGALFIYSMPGFWLGLMMIILFSLKLGVLPASQMESVDAEYMSAAGRSI